MFTTVHVGAPVQCLICMISTTCACTLPGEKDFKKIQMHRSSSSAIPSSRETLKPQETSDCNFQQMQLTKFTTILNANYWLCSTPSICCAWESINTGPWSEEEEFSSRWDEMCCGVACCGMFVVTAYEALPLYSIASTASGAQLSQRQGTVSLKNSHISTSSISSVRCILW